MRYDEGGGLFSPKRAKCVVFPEASDRAGAEKEEPRVCAGMAEV
jgi:hypothetical protein